jgi:hypothetical protein
MASKTKKTPPQKSQYFLPDEITTIEEYVKRNKNSKQGGKKRQTRKTRKMTRTKKSVK